PEPRWLGRTLAKQVSRLLGRQLLAETRFGQERMLLYSIINAVTDPILLTDTEGKLIIANTHAEKLFAAPEEASEGWRRAAALNNMLFSAALSTSAVGMAELARRELLLVDPLEGSDLLFELLSSRAKDERQGTYVVSILRNVTDLARAKEEIEESYRTLRVAQAEVRDERHRLDLIIDSVADPILVSDREGPPLRAIEGSVAGARAERPGSHGRARRAERAAAQAAHRARTGVCAQVAVPREHVARVQDAAERDSGLHPHAAEQRHRAGDGSAAQEPLAHRFERAAPARAHQRHPRHHAHRSGAHAAEHHQVRRHRARG